MVKVITTVGTSLFENFLKRNNSIKTNCEILKDKSFSEWKNYVREIDSIKNNVRSFIAGSTDASAEIKSLFKIREVTNQPVEVSFICSDTVLSKLAADIIKEDLNSHFDFREATVVEGLQINNFEEFESKGFSNLVVSIKNILMQKLDSIVLNISGGYKAIIPPLTILAQLYDVPITYIYEDSEELITFPRLPIHFDWSIAEQYYPLLQMLTQGNTFFDKDEESIIEEMLELYLVRSTNSKYKITPLGRMFKEYIDYEVPVADNTLGFFVEYKLFEFFLNNPPKDSQDTIYPFVNRSEKFVFGNKQREIDLVLRAEKNKNDKFIVAESKSYLQLAVAGSRLKVIEQIKGQLEIFKQLNESPIEFYLIIYSSNKNNVNKLVKGFIEIQNIFKNSFNNKCTFKVKYLEINLSLRNREFYKNPYSKFLAQPINNLTDINLP